MTHSPTNSTQSRYDIAIVGAGIVGLAMAYTAARRGLKVGVFERNGKAIGASIRNFGMIWPIGQPSGVLLERALRSREIYLDVAKQAGFWYNPNGSLHVAYHKDEWAVLEEFVEQNRGNGYTCELITDTKKIQEKSPAVKAEGLIGALWSETEMIVDPREVIATLPDFLHQKYEVDFHFGTAITGVNGSYLEAGNQKWQADRIVICSGADFETLYPELFASSSITKCKLQMMRTSSQGNGWSMGASLCAGLTLTHYAAFKDCPSLADLNERFAQTMPAYKKYGIHVLVSQNAKGELTLGDSHEYGLTPEPFDKSEIDQWVLDYLATFAHFPDLHIKERWHGIYPKLTNGGTELVVEAESNVWIVNGLGGAGMTLSLGLAEYVFESKLHESVS
ncbi:TIGR03364 family FAD-dependent oxidoreductase [Cytophagaceae bacterium DM2B3-1]|uniref:TIGR03364 family FAD-dependent oxidoreductase n=1 Tax=Xanthocytophaga flava TaxID=3048013 RepID=A0ABT7CNN5_9BACT|nr:TIGR03364 family FAD-dependent oxidoreductase [Xanthocytophaga flavus]MDJ1472129.1 TIGR03364 family FAD-dependent oxidoreductase [Xanthocytophaga flavus]MDJ1495126.1 TIGR03364 family FAD-dependent oxidoreductase [Xanthocytophaga flavus]